MIDFVTFLKYGDVAEFRNGLNFSKDSHGKGCRLIGVADFKDYFSPQWETLGEINPLGVAKKKITLRKAILYMFAPTGIRHL
ncbi:hypothetical protein [Dickeya solani]|uniref:hypothetical protein n=1 Tax=Dickeya solani TaxID=1089444 RepID=UPI0020C6DB48|nr:hypothetical protein [Dickeya solani]